MKERAMGRSHKPVLLPCLTLQFIRHINFIWASSPTCKFLVQKTVYSKTKRRQFFFISCSNLMHHLFITFFSYSSTCFEQHCAHHQEDSLQCTCSQRTLCTERSPKKSDIQRTRCCVYAMNPPDDEHSVARNMQRNAMNIINKWCIKLETRNQILLKWTVNNT